MTLTCEDNVANGDQSIHRLAAVQPRVGGLQRGEDCVEAQQRAGDVQAAAIHQLLLVEEEAFQSAAAGRLQAADQHGHATDESLRWQPKELHLRVGR